MKILITITTMRIIGAKSRGCRPYRGQNTGRSFRGQNFHGRGQRNQNTYQG